MVVHQATLNGNLTDDGGEACTCGFQWGLTNAYGNTTPTTPQTTGDNFSQVIAPLARFTTYHFRAFATNSVGTAYGGDLTFTTLAEVPAVATGITGGISATGATLNGQLTDDGGEACACGFQWGPTIAYGNTTPTTNQNTGDSFSQGIIGLTPGTTYHYRSFATNAAGTAYGSDATFTTIALATVTTSPSGAINTVATLGGLLNDDGGEACDCGFQWGLTNAYGNTTPTTPQTTGEGFYQLITGLTPGTLYHFRAFATNSAGTVYGGDSTFAPSISSSSIPAKLMAVGLI